MGEEEKRKILVNYQNLEKFQKCFKIMFKVNVIIIEVSDE